MGCSDEASPSTGGNWNSGQMPFTGAGGMAATGGVPGTGAVAGAGGALGTGAFAATGGVQTGAGGVQTGTGALPGTGGVVGAGGMVGGGGTPDPGTGGVVVVPDDGSPVPSAGCGKGDSPGSGDYSLDVDGTRRTYIVAAPGGYDSGRPYRLVFTWHYLNGSASGIARGGYYGLQSRSDDSAIFVSPEGIGAAWPNTGGRDVAFASAMLDWMKDNYCVDESRIFSTGFSYGAIMSNTVGCALGDQFRAIAPMSGSGPRGRGCTGQVAAWISHGDRDTVVSFSGGQGSRDHWLQTNNCGSQTTSLGDCVSYGGCDDGYPVHWCEYSGAHTQPRFAPAAIWAFFEQF